MRGAVPARRFLGGLCIAASLVFGQAVAAQQIADLPPATILTLDQERLFSESLYGKRVLADLERISTELAAHNREVTTELTAEEQALTEQRKAMPPADFRPLADAFDDKVTKLREEQDARIRDLQRRRDVERRAFTARVLPVLSALVREAGAIAILDERAVILSADHIDITDRAIARIDMLLGDGGDLGPAEDSTVDEVDDVTSPIGTDTPTDAPLPPETE